MIARSSSLWCKNFNVGYYSKSIKGINRKLGKIAQHDKMQLRDKGLTLKAIFLELCPFLTKFLSRMMAPDRRALVPHAIVESTDFIV